VSASAPTTVSPVADPAAASSGRPTDDIGFLVRSGALGPIGLVTSGIFQLLLVVIVARGLGPAVAGLFLEAIALVMILSKIGELGASTGLVRTVSRFRALGQSLDLRQAVDVAVWPVAIVSASLAVGTFVSAPQLAIVFFDDAHQAEATELIRLLAPVLPLASGTLVALAATHGLGTMMPYVVVQNIALPAARLLLVLVAILAGLSGVAAGAAWALPAAVAYPVSTAVLVKLLRRAEGQASGATWPPRAASELAAEFWRFAAPRGIAGILTIAVTWMDVLLVGALRSTREAAIYAAASRLAVVGAYALEAVGLAVAPRISAVMARGPGERVEALYRTATSWLTTLVWPFYMAVAVFSPWIMGVFGPEFVAGETALAILSAAMLVKLATGNVSTVLLLGGMSSWSLLNSASSLILNVVLNLLLTPRMGITGAAIAWAASITLASLAPLVQIRIFLGLRPPWGGGFLLVALAAGACYGALGMAVRHGLGMSWATFAIFVVTATGLYVAVLWRFRELLHFPELVESLRARGGRPRRRGAMAPQPATE